MHMQRIFFGDRRSALVDIRCKTYWAPRSKLEGSEAVYWRNMQERDENAGTGEDFENIQNRIYLLRAR